MTFTPPRHRHFFAFFYVVSEPVHKTHKDFQIEALQHIGAIKGNVPAHRNASKHNYSFSAKPFEQQLVAWDHIWRNTDDFWVRAHAIFFLERHMKKTDTLKQMWPIVMKWQDNVGDWACVMRLLKYIPKYLLRTPLKYMPP